jgi:hypothetical protein
MSLRCFFAALARAMPGRLPRVVFARFVAVFAM